MAQLMVIGPNYFVEFEAGQGAVASASYFTYAPDLSATLLTLFNTVNLHTNEINAVQGPVGILPLDLLQFDDSILRPTPVVSGLIGIDSYFPTIQANPNDNRVDVRAGVALAASDRVNQPTPVTLTATYSGGGDTLERFLAISNQGVPTLETLADQQVVDLWHFDLDSGSVLSNPTRLANVLFDGDDYDQLRIRRGSTPFFEGIDSIEFVDGGGGSDTLVRTVGDWTADGFVNGETFNVDRSVSNDAGGPYTITGITATTITVASGEFTAEGPSTGIRITGGHFRYSDFDQFHQRVEQIEDVMAGLSPLGLNVIFPYGTSGAPSLVMSEAPISDPLTGWYHSGNGAWGWSSLGVPRINFTFTQLQTRDGSPGIPFYSYISDPNSGVLSGGDDIIQISTGGVVGFEQNDSQQRTSALQGRYKAEDTGKTHSSTGNWQDITFEDVDEIEDVGGFRSGSSATHTIPSADYAGDYSAKAFVRFVADATGQRGLRLTMNGTIVSEVFHDASAAGVTSIAVPADEAMANTETMKLEVYQNSGGNLNYDVRFSFRKED